MGALVNMDTRIELSKVSSEVICLAMAMEPIVNGHASQDDCNHQYVADSLFGIESLLKGWYARLEKIRDELDEPLDD
jgi:hypothetical protein